MRNSQTRWLMEEDCESRVEHDEAQHLLRDRNVQWTSFKGGWWQVSRLWVRVHRWWVCMSMCYVLPKTCFPFAGSPRQEIGERECEWQSVRAANTHCVSGKHEQQSTTHQPDSHSHSHSQQQDPDTGRRRARTSGRGQDHLVRRIRRWEVKLKTGGMNFQNPGNRIESSGKLVPQKPKTWARKMRGRACEWRWWRRRLSVCCCCCCFVYHEPAGGACERITHTKCSNWNSESGVRDDQPHEKTVREGKKENHGKRNR